MTRAFPSVNQNSSNGDLIDIKRVFGGLLGLQPGRHRFQKRLNCVLQDYKTGEACKEKTARLQLVTRVVYQELQLDVSQLYFNKKVKNKKVKKPNYNWSW